MSKLRHLADFSDEKFLCALQNKKQYKTTQGIYNCPEIICENDRVEINSFTNYRSFLLS